MLGRNIKGSGERTKKEQRAYKQSSQSVKLSRMARAFFLCDRYGIVICEGRNLLTLSLGGIRIMKKCYIRLEVLNWTKFNKT